jgi:hypothetical protein
MKPPDGFTQEEWDDIRRLDLAAAAKSRTMPKCRICRGPMWCGQVGAHFVCLEQEKTE